MTDYTDSYIEDLRLSMLQILARAGGETNSRILATELPGYAHNVSADRRRTDLAWLAEQGLVTLTDTVLATITLTERGDDAAHGRITVPGLRRPAPHERR